MAEKGGDAEAPDTQTPASKQTKLELYLLQINIYRGEKLEVADLNGKSDPYCKVCFQACDKTQRHDNKQFYKTKVIEKNLNPEWNEETQFCFLEPVQEVRFEVWDWDKFTKGDRIGNVTLNVSEFFNSGHKGFNGQLQLKDVKTGWIYVKVTGRVIRPSELEERIGRLETTTKVSADNIASNTQTIDSYTREKNTLTSVNNNLSKIRNDLQTQQQNLTTEVGRLTTDVQQFTYVVGQLNKEIQITKAQAQGCLFFFLLKQNLTSVMYKEKDIKKNEVEIQKARQNRTELEKENKDKIADVESINDKLRDKQKQKDRLQTELKQLNL
ncbi:hypothetical protein RFI_03347 [Reticulomyxa filosa]|uniref:C2 domain-containing protein n=1 Tax=Reticulomyxa filosa TaxID=46433 RepID=X6P7Z9_RETFI|nr:hypothetical protein RFI_03347 [Reticulomyxa filosa]|eukprot:ETO33757.1 hypothetical protein RFI_03347 [Reticulomyxa filosa]